ncbi:MAG: hypothetical protein ACRC2T_03745 [Thermoguttaceae bacterium]
MAPKKLFQDFKKTTTKHPSDIDVVVVSSRWFNHFWHRLHDEQLPADWHTKCYNRLKSSIFCGYMDGKPINEIEKVRSEWQEIFVGAIKKLQIELGILHKINIRLYRSWEDFERYHILGLKRLKS